MTGLLLAATLLIFQGDFGPVRQPPNCFREVDAFIYLDEREHVAAFMAAEAMENLLVRIDVETGGLFFVKRAQGNEVGPGALEGKIGADDIHDVTGSTDLFAGRRGKQASHGIGPLKCLYLHSEWRGRIRTRLRLQFKEKRAKLNR